MIFSYEALALYQRTRQRGWWHRVAALLRGRSTNLLELAKITAGGTISVRRSLGAQIVPIGQIRGTEGRRTDFDNTFHPLQEHTRSRWLGIATAWLQGIDLPPVDLIRVGDIYFVRDGHHRISVVRALGVREIAAVVTILEVTGSQSSIRTSIGVPSWASGWLGHIQHGRLRLALSPMRLGDSRHDAQQISTTPHDGSGTVPG